MLTGAIQANSSCNANLRAYNIVHANIPQLGAPDGFLKISMTIEINFYDYETIPMIYFIN